MSEWKEFTVCLGTGLTVERTRAGEYEVKLFHGGEDGLLVGRHRNCRTALHEAQDILRQAANVLMGELLPTS